MKCPVTGEELGAHGPAIPVQVPGLGTLKPTLLQRLFRRPPKPDLVTVYVCCEGCIEKVKDDPTTYVGRVILESSGWEK